mmetsp:Transcript_13697/g.33717  ORF Transcript_13697/g.33717 Transcript_13697/m.33717 type:complete len:353 (+) Transcript_13697:1632-2690(+)
MMAVHRHSSTNARVASGRKFVKFTSIFVSIETFEKSHSKRALGFCFVVRAFEPRSSTCCLFGGLAAAGPWPCLLLVPNMEVRYAAPTPCGFAFAGPLSTAVSALPLFSATSCLLPLSPASPASGLFFVCFISRSQALICASFVCRAVVSLAVDSSFSFATRGWLRRSNIAFTAFRAASTSGSSFSRGGFPRKKVLLMLATASSPPGTNFASTFGYSTASFCSLRRYRVDGDCSGPAAAPVAWFGIASPHVTAETIEGAGALPPPDVGGSGGGRPKAPRLWCASLKKGAESLGPDTTLPWLFRRLFVDEDPPPAPAALVASPVLLRARAPVLLLPAAFPCSVRAETGRPPRAE